MRPFTAIISLDEAQRRLTGAVVPIARTERVGLADAAGRVAADEVVSAIDVPPFARSAMDGYALIAGDTAGASRRRAGAAAARRAHLHRTASEDDDRAGHVRGNRDRRADSPRRGRGRHGRRDRDDRRRGCDLHGCRRRPERQPARGADITAGSLVIRREDVLTPSRVGALAAIGCAGVEAYARPRVAILSTGNEVIEPGQTLGPGQIFDVNRFTLAAIVSAHGGVPEPHAAAHDSVEALTAALDRCLAADIVVFSGGSSVGERDLILDVIPARGEMIFHGIAVKPGKPTAFATIAGKPFFGMPGNPTSCLSNAYVLLLPFLRATARLPPLAPRTVRLPLARRIASPAGRHQFYTVRITNGAAWPAFKGSGDITSLSQADGYIQIPAGSKRHRGGLDRGGDALLNWVIG